MLKMDLKIIFENIRNCYTGDIFDNIPYLRDLSHVNIFWIKIKKFQ